MQRISLEIYTNAYEAIKILEKIADQKAEIDIPAGSVLLDNILNLKLIAAAGKKSGKSVEFTSEDPFGKNLIKILSGESDEVVVRKAKVSIPTFEPKAVRNVRLPSISLPKPKLNLSFGKFKVVLFMLPLLLIGLAFLFVRRSHRAEIVLYFSPQTLTKSVTVKVGDGLKTDLDKKVLSGLKISRSLDKELTANSTGVVLEGDKASGNVYLYNKTINEITLKKGTEITYEDNKEVKYVFAISTEVKIPARTDTPPDTMVAGKSEAVKVTAKEIGSSYNIKKDKELSVKSYDTSDLIASASTDFKGGSSEEVKVITQEDITKLEQELIKAVSASPADALKTSVANGYSFIDKSEKIVSKNVIINNKVGEKKDGLSGSLTAQVEALSYSTTELADFMGKLSENLVPPGFEFHSYNKDIKVEVLGNTENTVLSSTQADLQVTFKFFIIPKIDGDKVFADISGKSPQEAAKLLEAINGVEKVELNVSPNLPMLKKIPAKRSSVDIQTKVSE